MDDSFRPNYVDDFSILQEDLSNSQSEEHTYDLSPSLQKDEGIEEIKSELGSLSHITGEFNRPNSVSISNDGNILVADRGNHRVQVFSPFGQFLFMFGSCGKDVGQMNQPMGEFYLCVYLIV